MGKNEERWRWQKDRNPFFHHIFAILGLDDPDADSRAFDKRVTKLKQLLKYKRAGEVLGHAVTDADLAIAESLSQNANLVSEERLLAHKLHLLDLERFADALDAFEALDPGEAETMLPMALVDMTPIVRRLPMPGEISVDSLPAPDLSALTSAFQADPADEIAFPS